MVDVQPAGGMGNSDECTALAAGTGNSDDHTASMDKESVGGIVIDLNSNREEDGKEDARSENEHENGTEETAEMVDEKHLDENEDSKTGTPEPVVSFDNEPADRVPEPGFHTTIQNYCLSDSENDSLAMLKKPDFQMPIQRKPQRKERTSRRESGRQNGQNSESRRQHQSRMLNNLPIHSDYRGCLKCSEVKLLEIQRTMQVSGNTQGSEAEDKKNFLAFYFYHDWAMEQHEKMTSAPRMQSNRSANLRVADTND